MENCYVLSSDSNLISENIARSADNWMQLELEEGRPGDEFQVKRRNQSPRKEISHYFISIHDQPHCQLKGVLARL
jgi:hypothetical protein